MPLIGKNLAYPPPAGRYFWKISDIFNHRVFLEAERLITKSFADLFELNINHDPVSRIQTLGADKIAHSILTQYLLPSDFQPRHFALPDGKWPVPLLFLPSPTPP